MRDAALPEDALISTCWFAIPEMQSMTAAKVTSKNNGLHTLVQTESHARQFWLPNPTCFALNLADDRPQHQQQS